jgi:hypothetical protein
MASFSQKEMNQLRTIAYGGFVKKSVPRYVKAGAGKDARGGRRQAGYSQVTNYDAYNSGLLGRAARASGIKNVNRDDEIRRIYDFILGYQAPSKQAAPAAPTPAALTPVKISQASLDFRKESQALLNQANAARAKFAVDQQNAAKAAAAQRARDEAARIEREKIAAQTSAARSGNERIAARSANLQIQPASTTPQTAGTQPFKRRQLQFNPQTYGAVASMKSGILNI